MDINQIYSIVNSVTAQAMGSTAIAVIDEQSLISLGNDVLSSQTNTDNWTKTLIQRIGKTIISQRRYSPEMKRMLRDNFEWGAIVQKIKVDMPTAEKDDSFDIANGETVDPWVVSKQNVHQKLFVTETPWQTHISIQRVHLKEAFTSNSAMSSFISAYFGEVQNFLNVALEQLSMNTLNNYIAELNGGTREIKLVTKYNTAMGTSLTKETALHSDDFLRFCIKEIKLASDKMVRMTKGVFNDGTTTRHTPKELQNMYVLSDFERSLETVTQFQAFHDEYVRLSGYETIPFFQDIQSPDAIHVKRASDGTETNMTGIIACLFDYEALGTYRTDEWSASTGLNARGGYINYYWHLKDMYFNDLSENFVVFTLN